MAIVTRQITGPIETPEHLAVITGLLRVALLHPIAEDETLILPFKLEYNITDGELPASCQLTTPGKYQFRIFDYAEERVWSFNVDIFPNSGSSISVAELWLLSRIGGDDASEINLENVDAAILGSDGASDGLVLSADGNGGTEWRPIAGTGLGDMLKSIYDTDDNGQVDLADFADVADLANDSDLFGGIAPEFYQSLLPQAVNSGAILTWAGAEYTPNENLLIDDAGNISAKGIRLDGALYGKIYTMNQVYYLVQDETHIVVVTNDDVEIRLPSPTVQDSRVIEIKKLSSDDLEVLITSAGGGLIDDAASYSLLYKHEAITLVAANGEWLIF